MRKLNAKEIKGQLLDLLINVDKIFSRHSLNYSLAYGSLIGAARHKGFIPWDDDLDIVMPYEDYLKMLKLPELNKKGNRYTVHYSENERINNEQYNYPFAKIEDNYTKCEFKFTNDVGGAFLDIFPMTPIPETGQTEYFKQLLTLHDKLVFTYSNSTNPLKNFIHTLSRPLHCKYRDELINKAFEFTNSNSGLLVDATWSVKKVPVPKNWFENYTRLSFEGHDFKVISNYKEWLEKIYGDWEQLPPVEDQVAHHYFDLYI